MRLPTVVRVVLTGIAGFSGLLCAQPAITVEPSPNPGVVIVPVEQAGSSAADALLGSASPDVRPASFFIDNRTAQPILSLVVLCTGR